MTCYSKPLSDEEAAAICADLASSINKDRMYVQQQLAMYGKGITKKWKEKTVKNRAVILKLIAPDMYENKWHEPEIQHQCRHGDQWWDTCRKQRGIHLLPYISIENLKEDPTR